MKKYVSIMKLAALLVIAPVVIYCLALSDTFGLYREYVREKAVVAVPQDGIMNELKGSDPILSSGVLVRRIAGVCADNKVTVGHYSPVEDGREGSLRLVSARLDLAGDFIGLVKVLSCIESMREISVSSAGFRTVKVGRNGVALVLELKMMQVEEHGLS